MRRPGRDTFWPLPPLEFSAKAREIELAARTALFGVILAARRGNPKTATTPFAVGRVQTCAGIAQQVGCARGEFFASPSRNSTLGVVSPSARS